MSDKITAVEDAIGLIRDGDRITTSGFVGIGVPEALLKALETRFLDTGTPRGIKLFFAAGQGDGKDRGLNCLGHDGLVAEAIGGHWGLIPKMARLAVEGRMKAYNLPQGVISQQFREIAAGRPGLVTRVGLETFVDPRQDGGRINAVSTDPVVELIELGGREYLFYPAPRIDVALLRGTTADPKGNVTLENEALTLDNLSQAMAVKNSGGLVIVQVERIAAPGTLHPREVQIPGGFVDAVVVAEPGDHVQTFATPFSHAFTGAFRVQTDEMPAGELTLRKIIARRAAFELPVNGVVNLGIGMPEGVAAVAGEERLLDYLTLTTEPGVIGGRPASGLDFGAAVNTDAIIAQNLQFDFYDGGGLDLAILGMAEADSAGSVNVSRFGARLAGSGGFINISQNARALVFTGTFTSGGLETSVEDGALVIRREGAVRKFVRQVEQTTFAGARAAEQGRKVIYVTERCVLALERDGLHLVEVAPGVDIDRDILGQMDFAPILDSPKLMDARIFADPPMGLRSDLLALGIEDRIAMDPDGRTLFINFEKLRVRREQDVARIRARIEQVCRAQGNRVDVIVNYDDAQIDPEIATAYAAMVRDLEDGYYGTVTRFSNSAFMRVKIGDVLRRDVGSHVFETVDEAKAFLARTRDDGAG
ncbi:acyl CoA:acetate/3-ketoacid CoA transferase [Roseisalinus antarcticus]|uniref:Acetate CoA-transferase YdiF n=1 Tax=Roseisalinus antarcticus TaxID=254357 RepID=A0A1Y5SZX0_9RHOB|nr:CoA-transferase [Roseisalinus antarcticus]SLN52551.1 Acetate CoA-transferase YdiF [Roseisalinus antarcticus]